MKPKTAARLAGLLAIICLLSPRPSTGQATAYGMGIPSSHPRLWWNAERIARARAWYQSNQFSARSGSPEETALDNAFLYILTGNASNCRTALNAATSITVNDAAANSPTNGVASDGLRWYGEHVILTYDWCYSQMTQSDKDTLLNRWNNYLNNIRQHQWGNAQMYESNYNWGYLRNMLEWGITTYGDSSMADTFLSDALVNRWKNNFVPYVDSATGGRGGAWQEGSNYGPAMPGYTAVPFMSATLLGRDIFNESNFHRENIFYLIYSSTPAPTYHKGSGESLYEMFPFSDDERFSEGGFLSKADGYGDFMATMSDLWRDLPIGQYARRWVNMVNAARQRHIRAVDRGSAERDFGDLPLDYYVSGPAFLYGRNRWGSQATTWQLQLGLSHDEGHGHNELGNWQMWRNGRWVSRESTGYSDTVAGYGGSGGVDTNNAVAHNTILIGGSGGSARHENPTSSYTMRRLESRPEYAFAAVELTPAYSGRASRVIREFIFVRDLETMVVFDRLDSSSTKTFLAHFEQNPSVDQGSHVINAVNGDQALRVNTLVPSNATYRVVNEGGSVGQFRVEIDSAGSTQSYFLHTLQAKGASDANLSPSVADNGSSYVLTLNHPSRGTVLITLQKGMTSTGGGINVGGQNFSLTDGMMDMSVTSQGPSWGGAAVPRPNAPSNVRIIR